MKTASRTGHAGPYSPLTCLLLLLVTGIAIKAAAALELYRLAPN